MNPAPPLRTISDIERLLEAHADLHALLLHVESLGLSDAWIGAGFIRNSVWDVLHGRALPMWMCSSSTLLAPAGSGRPRSSIGSASWHPAFPGP
jgi:hypothetical protein